MNVKNKLPAYLPGVVLFCCSVIIGLLIYQDHGISWDEPIQRDLGNVCYNYIFNGDQTLKTYHDKALGTGFELPLVMLERLMKITDSRDIYLMRHLVTNIFFLFSAFCGYLLALRVFKNQFIACLGFILFAFHPRIYAHSFFNSKDIPFLSVCLITLLVCSIAFEKNKSKWYLLLGIVCGYATSVRSMGVMFLPCISFFFLIDILRTWHLKERMIPVLTRPIIFLIGFCGMLFVAWPYLWVAPVHNFAGAFKDLANIHYEGEILFDGKVYNSKTIPIEYMPVWFSLTIPELWLLCGISGFLGVIVMFALKPAKYLFNTPERNFLLYVACFFCPALAMVVFHGVNIDDWRHLYFIYPPFVMLALYVVNRLVMSRYKLIIQAACYLQVAIVMYSMVKTHPFQQVYFNNFVAHDKEYLRKHYDYEYWGCSMKQALSYIAETDQRSSIKIAWGMNPVTNNISMLPADVRWRFHMATTPEEGGDYFITNFRMHPDEFPYKEVFSIKVQNSSVVGVYKVQ